MKIRYIFQYIVAIFGFLVLTTLLNTPAHAVRYIGPAVQLPRLKVEVSAPKSVAFDGTFSQEILYTITVKNISKVVATQVEFCASMNFPPDDYWYITTLVQNTWAPLVLGGGGGRYPWESCHFWAQSYMPLNPGESQNFVIGILVTKPMLLVNTVRASSVENPTDVEDKVRTSVGGVRRKYSLNSVPQHAIKVSSSAVLRK